MSNALVPGFASERHKNQWIWWNAEATAPLQPRHFDLAAWQAGGSADAVAGRGSACRIQENGVDWFLRHYRRGGLIGKVLHDQYFWSGAAATRVVREINVTHRLQQMGLPAPRVVGGRLQKRGLIYRCDLITEALPSGGSMAEKLSLLTEPQWAAIGRCIASFHRQGLWHADLNTHNILLSGGVDDFKVWVIDFDRAQFREPNGHWQQDNLERLRRSVIKVSGGQNSAMSSALQSAWQVLAVAYKEALQ